MDPTENEPVLVVGAGIMGAGIAQVAAQAGHPVALFDARAGASAEARERIAQILAGLAAKGRMSAEAATAAAGRIVPVASLDEVAPVKLVIEAIFEDLDSKRELFRELARQFGPECVLASNTSSISVTALSQGLEAPGRLVGMHFFNPVPLMKLVEVVTGLHTDPSVADAIDALARRWGKTPVRARSTPGFIVNRIARPFYAEALALLHEQVTTAATLDACIRAAGFRMGPCELMDLIGHDTNLAVTESVFHMNFGDRRYAPSLVQREMVDGGLLGRKSGRGFYEYPDGRPRTPPPAPSQPGAAAPDRPSGAVAVHGSGPIADRWLAALGRRGESPPRHPASHWVGIATAEGELRLTDGRPALRVAAEEGVQNLAVFDLPTADTGVDAPLAFAVSEHAEPGWPEKVEQWLRFAGFDPHRVRDAPALIVARTIAMLANEAGDAVWQGVCSAEAANLAMKLGVNYPAGPLEWIPWWGATRMVATLRHLDEAYRGERYRVSPHLARQAWSEAARATHAAP